MIGPKKLADVVKELRQKLNESHSDLHLWLDQRNAELQPGEERKPRVLEDLYWVKQVLRETTGSDGH